MGLQKLQESETATNNPLSYIYRFFHVVIMIVLSIVCDQNVRRTIQLNANPIHKNMMTVKIHLKKWNPFFILNRVM